MSTGSLNQKRILVTDVESDFGKEIANAVVAEGALVFTLVKECHGVQQVLDEYPQLTPILLDIGKEKCQDQAKKLLLSLPSVDHFVNLSGDVALNVISQAYTNSKIHDVNDIKAKPIIAKMIESGNRGLIFNVSFGNQNMMSKLKANLDPRFTNSKTAQFSTNLRQSLKKMFSNGSDDVSTKQNGNSSTTTTTTSRTEQTIVKEHNVATNFAAMATSLNQTQNGHQNGTSSSATTNGATTKSTSTTTSLKTQTLQEKNNKIKKSVLKMGKTCSKKWKKAEKRVQKEQESALKALHKEVEKGKRIEKSNILKDLSDANAATASRANALSADTANKILESRQNKADKEAEKHAQKKLEKETPLILENKDVQLKQYHEKLYKKTIDKQINEFNRIKNKYLV